jgi:hypothetical protein
MQSVGQVTIHIQHEPGSLLHASFLLGLLMNPEDGGTIFSWNISWISLDDRALCPRRHNPQNYVGGVLRKLVVPTLGSGVWHLFCWNLHYWSERCDCWSVFSNQQWSINCQLCFYGNIGKVICIWESMCSVFALIFEIVAALLFLWPSDHNTPTYSCCMEFCFLPWLVTMTVNLRFEVLC